MCLQKTGLAGARGCAKSDLNSSHFMQRFAVNSQEPPQWSKMIRTAIDFDTLKWHVRFADALSAGVSQGSPIHNEVINLDAHDWLQAVAPFDIVVINEMSFAYVDTVLYKASGYYELEGDDLLIFRPGHVWPQELWVDSGSAKSRTES